MDARAFVESVLVVSQRYNIDATDLGTVLRKLVVASVKYVSQRSVWSECFGEDYVDWDLLSATVGSTRGLLPGIPEWLALLAYMSWDDMCKQESTMAVNYPVLHTLRAHLKACSLDTGGEQAWTLVCKVCVLHLIRGLPTLNALEMLTCAVFKTNTHDPCIQLLARQAENLYTPEQYQDTLVYLLKAASVNTKDLHQVRSQCLALQEERRLNLKLSRITVFKGRPRLRDRLTKVYQTEERKTQVDVMLSTWESFTGFCYRHQFPVTLSTRLKTLLYFLASQSTWPWQRHLSRILPPGSSLLAKVAAHPVTQPVSLRPSPVPSASVPAGGGLIARHRRIWTCLWA